MQIVETPIFTRRITALMTADEYQLLQIYLIARPDAGAVVPGGGGLRKLRWMAGEKGKRGGVRVIYYWAVSAERLLMLFLYPKAESEDLSRDQIKALRKVVESEYPWSISAERIRAR